jgi:hypothetical protein
MTPRRSEVHMKHPFEDKSNTEIINLINEYIHSERDRQIMKRRLVDGICYEPLAEEFDLSTIQAKRIVLKQTRQLSSHS